MQIFFFSLEVLSDTTENGTPAQSMLDEMGALVCGPVAQEEVVYQDLVICRSALQCLGLLHSQAVCGYRGLPCNLWGPQEAIPW